MHTVLQSIALPLSYGPVGAIGESVGLIGTRKKTRDPAFDGLIFRFDGSKIYLRARNTAKTKQGILQPPLASRLQNERLQAEKNGKKAVADRRLVRPALEGRISNTIPAGNYT